jgi:ankyrin repeat protein
LTRAIILVLTLADYTTQEFFDRTRESKFPDSQINIASTCITYLSFDVFEKGPCVDREKLELRFKDYAFLKYAAKYWGHHAQGEAEEACQETTLMFLQNNLKVLCASQVMYFSGYSQNFPKGISGVHIAAFFGMKVTADSLLKNGAEADSKDSSGRTPLSWAAENGHEAVVKLLLGEEGVEVDSKDRSGQIPLSWAAGNGHEAVVKLLLEKEGVEVDSKGRYCRTPLSWAAGNGHEAVVKLLLGKEGVEADSKDKDGWTPLLWAAENGHEAVVKLLLGKEGVEVDSKGRYGRTPLSWAAVNGHEAVVKLLLGKEGVEADSKDKDGRTPLSWAAGNGHEAVAKLLESATRPQ